ncbi:MAG TPA: Uma2 family endonuclease [Urbifossiella sp.]|nr:Uma2 family endonuclease [Urbifossiella sp.]
MPVPTTGIVYPESDGRPIALGTAQVRWVYALLITLEARLRKRRDVFVAAGLIWYPVEGRLVRIAPDVIVAFGRPKGDRRSYKQWQEGGVAPQVVFEAMGEPEQVGRRERQAAFYSRHGVEEFYEYDTRTREFTVRLRSGGSLGAPVSADRFVSPRLGVRFECVPGADPLLIEADDIPVAGLQQTAARIERMKAKLRELGLDPDAV